MASDKPESLLVLSDLHRGAAISNLPVYEKSLLKKMGGYDHVVLGGDIFELFYIDPTLYKRFHPDGSAEKQVPKYVIKHAIKKSIDLLDEFLKENPKCHLHFVLGNHDNIRKFRHELDKLQEDHANFEWDPAAIRVGDALFIHGDLALDKPIKPDKTKENDGLTLEGRREYRVRDAVPIGQWRHWLNRLHEPGQLIDEYASQPGRVIPRMHAWLEKKAADRTLSVSHERHREKFDMSWVKHVFFGHTHIKFCNEPPVEGVHYYNTGALVRSTSGQAVPHGMLEATIEDGAIVPGSVRPVEIEKSKAAASR